MKKVAFLIAMIVLSFNSFGQYDVVTVPSEQYMVDNLELGTWYQVEGVPGKYYLLSEDDEYMSKYVRDVLNQLGADVDSPSRVEEVDGIVCRIYDNLVYEGIMSTVVVTKDQGLVIFVIMSDEE